MNFGRRVIRLELLESVELNFCMLFVDMLVVSFEWSGVNHTCWHRKFSLRAHLAAWCQNCVCKNGSHEILAKFLPILRVFYVQILLNAVSCLFAVACVAASGTGGSQGQEVWGGVSMFEKLEIHNQEKKMDK